MQSIKLLKSTLKAASFFTCVILASLATSHAFAVAEPGKPAPAFNVQDAAGKTHSLEDYQGQWLVLEWFNKDCPFVKKHYGSGNMQALQERYTDKGVKWLTVISSAEGKQGYLTPAQAKQEAKAHKLATGGAFIIDSEGTMGEAYGAKTTPHMFVINPEGRVVYAGAIDDNDSANPAVIPESTNYVAQALDQAMADKPVSVASSRAYGCSVKY